jgi:amidohydrolase
MLLKQTTQWVLQPILLLLITTVQAQKNQQPPIDQRAAAILPKVIEWRRYLHLHPELSNREFQTARYITDHLKKLGLEVQPIASIIIDEKRRARYR